MGLHQRLWVHARVNDNALRLFDDPYGNTVLATNLDDNLFREPKRQREQHKALHSGDCMMSAISLEERRKNVADLLRTCFDHKVLVGGADLALPKAHEAYTLAHTEPKLPSPWPELAAYRLAHLHMRFHAGSLDDLWQIERLFAATSHTEQLGLLPSCCHLAVLHRLELALADGPDKDAVRIKMRDVYRYAAQIIRKQCSTAMAGHPQQHAAFNLLEIVGYCLAMPYEDIAGIPSVDPFDQSVAGGWFLVGRNIRRINMTEALARLEFDTRATQGCALQIELRQSDARIRHGARWKPINQEMATLLLLALPPRIARMQSSSATLSVTRGQIRLPDFASSRKERKPLYRNTLASPPSQSLTTIDFATILPSSGSCRTTLVIVACSPAPKMVTRGSHSVIYACSEAHTAWTVHAGDHAQHD